MRRLWSLFLCLAVTAGCQKPKGTVLGRPPSAGPPRTILAITAGETPREVTLCGIMVEKCPVAGCWFRLRDQTGIIKVDTKAAGFVVVNVPLEATLTVAGKVAVDGDQVLIEATGIRY